MGRVNLRFRQVHLDFHRLPKSGFCQMACRADQIETTKAVRGFGTFLAKVTMV
jgi:hypothetical protein